MLNSMFSTTWRFIRGFDYASNKTKDLDSLCAVSHGDCLVREEKTKS